MTLLEESSIDISSVLQVAVVFVFLVLPVLRGIVQSRKKQREQQERRRRAQGEVFDEPAERKGQSEWERLLRGEPQEPRRPPTPIDLGDLFPEVREEEVAPAPPRTPPQQQQPVLRERAADQSMGTPAFDTDLGQRKPSLERRPELTSLSTANLSTFDDDLTAPTRQRPARRRAGVSWRRAVVLAEVLGTPVALRQEGAWPGAPPGLQR